MQSPRPALQEPFSAWVTRRRALRGRPHILRNGRTTHKEIPEGDTPEELELAAKMKEARPSFQGSGNVPSTRLQSA